LAERSGVGLNALLEGTCRTRWDLERTVNNLIACESATLHDIQNGLFVIAQKVVAIAVIDVSRVRKFVANLVLKLGW